MDFRGRPFDFWGFMGSFRKNILHTAFEGKKACKEIPGKNDTPHWKKKSLMTYNAEKILHRYMSGKNFSIGLGKKILTQTESTIPGQKSQIVNPSGGGGRNGFDTFVNDIHQQHGWRAFVKTKVLHFKIENTPIMTEMKKKEISKECSVSFLWTNESFSLWNCLSRKSSYFLHDGALGLFWTNQGSDVFKETSHKNFVFIKVSWTFSTFWHRSERKTKMNYIEYRLQWALLPLSFAMCSAD